MGRKREIEETNITNFNFCQAILRPLLSCAHVARAMPATVVGVRIFFQWGSNRGFFQIFSRRGSKVLKCVFSHSKLRKQPFFTAIFKILGGEVSPLCTPSDAHGRCSPHIILIQISVSPLVMRIGFPFVSDAFCSSPPFCTIGPQ